METIWFCLVAAMLALYVVFDGFDLGAAAVHLYVARDDAERRMVMQSIGAVWDGNEVWLLAAAGTLYFAFPRLYSASFSGFYLPLIMVLWLLMLRAVSLEFRGHIDSPAWKPLWDVVFSGSSALLAVFFGAALGNVVRGVPIDASGYFFLPLWTDFRLGAERGIIDWFTITAGVAALLALVTHGCLWIVLKTEGAVHERAGGLAARCWWGVVASTGVLTTMSLAVQPQIAANLRAKPWGLIFPVLAVAGLAGIRWMSMRGAEMGAFLASCTYLLGMLTSVAFGLYPYVLPAAPDPSRSLTVHNAAAGSYGLWVGLLWWTPGIALVTAYFVYTYRRFAGKVVAGEAGY